MAETIGFGLNVIEQVALPVDDLDRAVNFYRNQLGIKFLFESNGLAFFDCAGVRLLLSRPEGVDASRAGSVIYFKVDDIHAAYKSLLSRGVPFMDSPHKIADMGSHELWMAFFRDSEQNILAISGNVVPD
jgi:predicted enzyme related to lactoylglutathione lyase